MQIPGLLGLDTLAKAGSGAVRLATNTAAGFGARLGNALSPPEVSAEAPPTADAGASVRALQARLRGALSAEGITLTEPVTLVQDQFDRIRVVGDHPQRERIESLLAAQPELGDALRDLARSLLQRQSTGATSSDVPTAYEHDGKPTVPLTLAPLETLRVGR